MKKILLSLMAMLCTVGTWAATIGMTQDIHTDTKTIDNLVIAGTDNVTMSTAMVFGSKINSYIGTAKTPSLNGEVYTSTNIWRKSNNGYHADQWLGFEATVAQGYKMSITGLAGRLIVCDDTYNWKIQVLNASGTVVYTSAEQTTKKATSADFSTTLSGDDLAACAGLTGKVTVRIYLTQGGSTKYFTCDHLTANVTVESDSRSSYAITVTKTPDNGGSVTESFECTEGENAVLTATPATGYKFVKWTVDGNEVTTNPYTIQNVTAAHSAEATFEALKKATFDKGEGEGIVPAAAYGSAGDAIAMPKAQSQLLYKEGATLTGFNDGTKTYGLNESLTINEDVTLTAVFAENTVALGDAETTVNWTFETKNGAPAMAFENNIGYYAKKVTINNTALDVIMKINTVQDAGIQGSRGKCNTTSADNRAQVNKGTVFTIPAMKGMVITYTGTNGTPKTTSVTFGGENGTVDGTKVSYTYNGEDETIDIIDQGDNLYPSGLSVVYPLSTNAAESDLSITSSTTIELNIDEATDKTSQITYTTSSEGAVRFTSDNDYVATVNENGLITMNHAGTATITVSQEGTPDYQAGSATIDITVVANTASSSEVIKKGDVIEKDIDIVKTAVTLPGTFIAGASGVELTLNGAKNYGVKVRTANGQIPELDNLRMFAVNVNEGETVTGVDFVFANNYANTSTITGIYVDGDYTKNYLTSSLTSTKDKNVVGTSISDLEAKEKIEFTVVTTPDGDVTGTQINFLAEFKYVVPTYSLTINKNIADAGTFTATVPKGQTLGNLIPGATVLLSATAAEDFAFAKWIDAEGNTLSKNATYTYTMTSKNTTVTAVFKSTNLEAIATIETGNDEYALFTPTQDCELQGNAQAYIIKSVEGNTALIYPVETLAAGKGYLIKAATKGATVKAVDTTEEPTSTEGNMIIACIDDTPLIYSPATCSRYTEGNGVLQPINYNTVIPAGQAYIEVAGKNNALFAYIVDPAKAPVSVNNAKAAKANGNIVKVVNGMIVIETAEGNTFTTAGAQTK